MQLCCISVLLFAFNGMQSTVFFCCWNSLHHVFPLVHLPDFASLCFGVVLCSAHHFFYCHQRAFDDMYVVHLLHVHEAYVACQGNRLLSWPYIVGNLEGWHRGAGAVCICISSQLSLYFMLGSLWHMFLQEALPMIGASRQQACRLFMRSPEHLIVLPHARQKGSSFRVHSPVLLNLGGIECHWKIGHSRYCLKLNSQRWRLRLHNENLHMNAAY